MAHFVADADQTCLLNDLDPVVQSNGLVKKSTVKCFTTL